MRWHHEKRTVDHIIRHLADSLAWQLFDEGHQSFGMEPRNVILGLASDEFNSFSTLSTIFSWSIVNQTISDFPPWLCMKQPYMMLSLFIPGPTSPGNEIDVYLRQLIDELKKLCFDGINSYDNSMKETFKTRAAILQTISQLPMFAMLFEWSTKGKLAYPS